MSVSYVPVATDYQDLFPIMAFFRGGRDGAGEHDELAREIGLAGKHWAENHWREIDMQVYFYRLLIEVSGPCSLCRSDRVR